MKKFMFIFHGFTEPTQANKDAWMNWFGEIGGNIVDSGNPFGAGREVTRAGRSDLPMDPSAASGYTIVNAESMEAAEKLLENCPMETSVHIYEAVAM